MVFQRTEPPSYLAPDSGPSAKDAPPPQPAPRLYTIAALLRGGRFEGRFHARGESYEFAYTPTRAALAGNRLELTGSVSVRGRDGSARSAQDVRARLLAIQGSVADAPPRRQAVGPATAGATAATSDQKQEKAKAPELQQPAGPEAGRDRMGPDAAASGPAGLPVTESTGPRASAGVLFFELSPLDGTLLGVPVEMKRVQLNARLAPDNDRDRDLFWSYSDVVAALAAKPPRAAEPIRRLSAALRG
jgi:hypothetical protein